MMTIGGGVTARWMWKAGRGNKRRDEIGGGGRERTETISTKKDEKGETRQASRKRRAPKTAISQYGQWRPCHQSLLGSRAVILAGRNNLDLISPVGRQEAHYSRQG